MAKFAAVELLDAQGSLLAPTRLLLAAVSSVPTHLVATVRVLPKERNWLRFPWYSAAQGGGAFLLGDRIYADRWFFTSTHAVPFLFLLAHEVGHLRHAERFGRTGLGRARFVTWAAGHYLRSAIMHGQHAHRLSRIEQEAERGRWVLRELLQRSASDPLLAHLDDEAGMQRWLTRNAGLLARLHGDYPGWKV